MNNIVNKRTYLQQEIFCCFFVGKATAWVHKTKFELNLAKNLCKTGKRLVLQGGQNSNYSYKHKTYVQNANCHFALKQGRPRHHVATKEKHVEHPRFCIGRVAKII